MPHVKEKKTVFTIRYRDRSRDPAWAYDSLPKDSYSEAEADEEAEWRWQLYRRGKYDPWVQEAPDRPAHSDTITLMDAVDAYVEEKREMGRRGESGGWSEKTYQSDAPILKQFARQAGPSMLLRNLKTGHLQSFIYQENLAEATKRGRWVRLRAMLSWMEERDWTDPPNAPGKPQQRERVKTTITPEQLETIITAYEHLSERMVQANKHTTTAGVDWHPDGWRVAYYQGFRRSELLNLRVRNVLLEDGMIQVGDRDYQQKGKRETLIPLVDPAREVLEPYVKNRKPAERVFRTPETNDKVSRHFRRAVDFAADPGQPPDKLPFEPLDVHAPDVDLYTLRHSCATYWLRQKKRLIWVKGLMRHKDIDTTMGYVHLLPTDLKQMYQTGASS